MAKKKTVSALAKKMLQARKARKVSQSALAAELGISSNTISSWEQGIAAPNGKNGSHLLKWLEGTATPAKKEAPPLRPYQRKAVKTVKKTPGLIKTLAVGVGKSATVSELFINGDRRFMKAPVLELAKGIGALFREAKNDDLDAALTLAHLGGVTTIADFRALLASCRGVVMA